MKRINSNVDRLNDIINQIDFIRKYTNVEEDSFYRDEVLKLAILKSLEIIGEAASQVTRDVRSKYPNIKWEKMITARNYYVHEYFAVDWTWVWASATINIDFEKIKNYCSYIIEQIKTEL
jgi:uncharacterized protein with HEPN domain